MKNIFQDSLKYDEPKIMGILNVTPDSFSDGGKYISPEAAISHGLNLLENGADIIDIGGESTRPGSEPVSIDVELKRVIPVIEGISKHAPKVEISIDTTKSEVAEAAVNMGARIVNDISAGSFDSNIFRICAKYDVPLVIMHMKGKPQNMQDNPAYTDVIEEISSYFHNKINDARKIGVKKLIIDPGIGFGKRIEDNYKILNNLRAFCKFNHPLLVGVSKKSFLGNSLNISVDKRENATVISETIAVLNGANIIRTHNVGNAVELKKIMAQLKGVN